MIKVKRVFGTPTSKGGVKTVVRLSVHKTDKTYPVTWNKKGKDKESNNPFNWTHTHRHTLTSLSRK